MSQILLVSFKRIIKFIKQIKEKKNQSTNYLTTRTSSQSNNYKSIKKSDFLSIISELKKSKNKEKNRYYKDLEEKMENDSMNYYSQVNLFHENFSDSYKKSNSNNHNFITNVDYYRKKNNKMVSNKKKDNNNEKKNDKIKIAKLKAKKNFLLEEIEFYKNKEIQYQKVIYILIIYISIIIEITQ